MRTVQLTIHERKEGLRPFSNKCVASHLLSGGEKVLLKVENLTGCPSMDGYITVIEIPQGLTTGMHTHPGHEFGYWLEGEGV